MIKYIYRNNQRLFITFLLTIFSWGCSSTATISIVEPSHWNESHDLLWHLENYLVAGDLGGLVVGEGNGEEGVEITNKYEITINILPDQNKIRLDDYRYLLTITENRKKLFSWKCHRGSGFLIHDDILYYTRYSRLSSGCRIIAYDLVGKSKKWETQVTGLGPIRHSRYRNSVYMWREGPFDDFKLAVCGNETAGSYIEYLDFRTGKTLFAKVDSY